MRTSSIILKTESIFWLAEGEVINRGDYILVRTPSNPTYYGGNLLFFDHSPTESDCARWLKLFENEFKDEPDVKHMHFLWDVNGDDTDTRAPFVSDGFEIQSNVALTAAGVIPPPKLNNEIEVRCVETDEEWAAVLDAKLRARDARFELATYEPFKRKWLDVRRSLAEQGHGNWYGAYIGDRLVGDLGLFHDGSLGRFQDVGTEPEFRRRGICGTLVYEVSKMALEKGGIETLVMAADENYHAARIYESVGFRPMERHASACRYPDRT